MVDVFLPAKRNKEGKRFAFVRFAKRVNMNDTLVMVNGLWIGNHKIIANIARFDRTYADSKVKEEKNRVFAADRGKNIVGVSYVQVVKKNNEHV